MPFTSSFKIIKAAVSETSNLFWIFASIAEAVAVIPNKAKIFFAYGTATFINGSAILLNNDPKIPPDYIILDISVLDNFTSVNILFSNAFLSLVFLSCC